MTDPLDVLREPDGPVAPDPGFAARLRARLERALELPRGVSVSVARLPTPVTTTDRPSVTPSVPAGAAIPYLAVQRRPARHRLVRRGVRGRRAGRSDRHAGRAHRPRRTRPRRRQAVPGRRVPGDRRRRPGRRRSVRQPGAGRPRRRRAGGCGHRARGPSCTREIAEAYGSRNATIVDPFGHRWMLQQSLTTVPASRGAARAVASGRRRATCRFRCRTPTAPRPSTPQCSAGPTRSAASSRCTSEGQSMSHRHLRRAAAARPYCAYAVGDADAAIERVRAAGGTAEAPTEKPWGRSRRLRRQSGHGLLRFRPARRRPGGAAAHERRDRPVTCAT